jgi:hypothetical protein
MRYAQIEKEALAMTWAYENFSTYIIGRSFLVETDHKPLVPLLDTRHLDDLQPRVLTFCLQLAKYEYVADHVPGKFLYAADALSRAPTHHMQHSREEELQEEVEAYVNSITLPSIPATSQRLLVYKQAQAEDSGSSRVIEYFCKTQWPEKTSIESSLKPYWRVRGSFSHCGFNSRIVVPPSLRRETLLRIPMKDTKEWRDTE